MAMLFEPYLLEQIGRVQQPPKCERTLASLRFCKAKSAGNRLERENQQGHKLASPRENSQDNENKKSQRFVGMNKIFLLWVIKKGPIKVLGPPFPSPLLRQPSRHIALLAPNYPVLTAGYGTS
jgi:hypothetical protein